jgi:hypothetical protein
MKYLNFGVEYSPDLVLVAFLTGNDFRNNSKYLNRESAGFYFSFDEKHNLALDRSLFDEYQRSLTLPKRLFQTLKRYSYLASLISERLYLLRIQLHENHFMLSSLKSAEAVGGRALNEFSDLNIYCTPLTTRWQEAVDITKGIILKFRASVEERGAKFALVSLSNAEQVHRDVGQRLEAQYGLSFDYDQPDNIMEDFAGQNGITYLKLMPLFRDYHVKTGKYLHGFGSGHGGHWNEYGHRLAAEEIFKFLMGNRLVPIGEGT